MQVCRNCQNAMNTYPASTRIEDPAASPSSPSVRFTACEEDVSTTNTQTEKKTPRSSAVGRTKERLVDVPVSPENATTSSANSTDTRAVPMNFCAFDRPRERCLLTFR